MIRHIVFLLSACLVSAATLAQTHLKGQRFIEVQGGLMGGFSANNQLGVGSLISTGRYNRQYNAWKVTASYLQKPIIGMDNNTSGQVQQFSIGWGYEFNLWRNAYRTRFIRGTIQPLATYEVLPSSTGARPADSTGSKTLTGTRLLLVAEAGLELELSPVVINLRQRWLPTSRLQPFYTLISVGWRWHKK